jgi:hypothetical protein
MYAPNDPERGLICHLRACGNEALKIITQGSGGRILTAALLPAISSSRAQGTTSSSAPDIAHADTASGFGQRKSDRSTAEMEDRVRSCFVHQCPNATMQTPDVFRLKREVVSHDRPSQLKPGLVVAAILLISSPICRQTTANGAEAQVCDVSADYLLGVEDYADSLLMGCLAGENSRENS